MESALLLDRNYMAISIVGWKKAFKLLMRGKAEPIGNNTVRSIVTGNRSYNVPSIIKLKNPISYNCFSKRIVFSRKNIMLRDGYKCQYCGAHLPKNSGTIDHVIPRSKGGKTDYTNCVACCKRCNNEKRDRTPEEADMRLLSDPKRPNNVSLYRALENIPEEWNTFIGGMA